MAHVSSTTRHAPVHQRRWRRDPRRQWARPNDVGSALALFALIPSLPRAELATLATRMIDRLDEIDGDFDVELNGDEQDGDGDDRDLSWSEWHTRAASLSPAGYEAGVGEIVHPTEDDEDDDPAGGSADDVREVEEYRPRGVVLDLPRYGIDQAAGPTNERDAQLAFHRAQAALPPLEKFHA